MKYNVSEIVIFLIFMAGTWSCETENIDPDNYFHELNEVKLTCFLADYNDTLTSSKELWVGYKISSYLTNENFIGHCWNFNTDTLPTIESMIRKEPYSPGIYDLTLLNYDFIEGPYRTPFRTGIPLTEYDTMVTVRSFLIFNDSLIRYSPPLKIDKPLQYASK